MAKLLFNLLLLPILILAGGVGTSSAYEVEPAIVPFSFADGTTGWLENAGGSPDGTSLSFRAHVTSGALDQIRMYFTGDPFDPFYIASSTPGPDVDVTALAGAAHLFFTMNGGLQVGEASDIFTATFPNRLVPGSTVELKFYGEEYPNTDFKTVLIVATAPAVPSVSPLGLATLCSVLGLAGLRELRG